MASTANGPGKAQLAVRCASPSWTKGLDPPSGAAALEPQALGLLFGQKTLYLAKCISGNLEFATIFQDKLGGYFHAFGNFFIGDKLYRSCPPICIQNAICFDFPT